MLREINIKSDMPTVDTAIRRVTFNLHNAKKIGATAIKFIHGYGSTGKGGVLRVEIRKYLAAQLRKGSVRMVINGEDFSIFDEDTRRAFDFCGELRNDLDLERHNNGVTFIIL